MADFFTRLFESIFTPGATPTLVVATNISFSVLQLVLLVLLIATYSVHFLALSIISGGLWWSINWFVNEIRAADEKEQRAKKLREERKRREEPPEDSGTETEEASPATRKTAPSSSSLQVREDEALKKRRSLGDISGTDSEWDKVSENESTEG